MIYTIGLLIGISVLLFYAMFTVARLKKIPLKTTVNLFLFGMALSIPFLIVEYLAFNLRFSVVILSFIAIEIGILFLERHVKYFHDLIHHNVKHLRFASFILIGIGFTYSEVAAFVVDNLSASTWEILKVIPQKAMFGIFIHTILTSSTSLVHAGALLAENILETFLHFLSYYARLFLISVSHYLYVFFSEHEFSLYFLPFLTFNLVFFFWIKSYLDKKRGLLPE